MNEIIGYNETMSSFGFRKEAVERVLLKIKNSLKNRKLSEDALKKIGDVLCNYDVEDGVTVFFPSGKPAEKFHIGTVDVGKEYAQLWWGENLSRYRTSNPNIYSLGITFKDKTSDEISYYTHEELANEFPDFVNFFNGLEKGTCIRLFCYSRVDFFMESVKSMKGKWLIQVPVNGKVVSGRSIGLNAHDRVVHIFQVNKKFNAKRFSRRVQIV